MPPPAPEPWDVVILGGGMAALCLARLLQREAPRATVIGLDKAAGPRRKVGESTVEIGAHFLNARLGLGPLLAKTQLPKNGLRFWFDSPEHDLPFQEASEDGPATFAYWRTYQLERDTFEASLLELNRSNGGTHLFGVKGLELGSGEDGARHHVAFEADGRPRQLSARWLVDATGIRSFHGRANDNLVPDPRLTHSACWAWFDGVQRLDSLIEAGEGPARFNWGPRLLSTNHLLNEGYWIWVIPLASGLTSVGMGYDETVVTDPPRTLDAFCAFLRTHRMARDLLDGARPLEFGVLKRFTFKPRKSITADRVAWVGTAAGFVDPFFSNGVDMIALGCEATADTIRRDLGGDGLCPRRLACHDATLDRVYEHFLTSVRGLYPTYGSQELSLIRYRRDVHVYWAIYSWPYMSGQLAGADLDLLERYHALFDASTRRGRFFSALLLHAYDSLKARGALHRNNRGQFTFNQLGFRNTPYVRFEQQMGHPPDVSWLEEVLAEIDAGCFLAVLDVLTDADRSPLKRLLFESVHPIHELLMTLWEQRGAFDAEYWDTAWRAIAGQLHDRLAEAGHALPRIELDATVYRRLLPNLLDRCQTDDQALAVRKHFNQPPRLRDFSHLAPSREDTQPSVAWSVDHTPWLEAAPEFQSVYDLLGETWWTNPKTPFSALVRWGVRPLLSKGP